MSASPFSVYPGFKTSGDVLRIAPRTQNAKKSWSTPHRPTRTSEPSGACYRNARPRKAMRDRRVVPALTHRRRFVPASVSLRHSIHSIRRGPKLTQRREKNFHDLAAGPAGIIARTGNVALHSGLSCPPESEKENLVLNLLPDRRR